MASTDPEAPPSSDTRTRRRAWGRWLLLLLVGVAVALFFALHLDERLKWDYVKAQREELQGAVGRHPVLSVAVYFAVYVAVTGLSLPGAAILSLIGGALFGRWLGTAIVSFASTTGATLAFLLCRYLFRDAVQRRFGPRLQAVNREVEANGPFYLLTLRLVPAFPFFVVNAVMALTPLRVWTFWWVSQLGMLPGTFLYLNAGTELGRIRSPGDVLSPTLIASFALLGVVPLLVRKGVQWWKRRGL